MTLKGQSLGKRIMDKPMKNSKWNKAQIEPIIMDMQSGMKRKDASAKHGISIDLLGRKMEQYHAGELK